MTQILANRKARKPYLCENSYPDSDAFLYGHPEIQPGDTYLRIALTPHDYEISNSGWRTARYCRACADAVYGRYLS